jgi:DNA helicase II / ATP-dependent DNA helicase PcrA
MTRRVVFLVEDQGVNPSAILGLTFSRAAAGELRERLEVLLGKEAGDRPTVSTLHGFALRQLLLNGSAPTLPQPIRIADDFDERHVIIEEIAKQMGSGFGVRKVKSEMTNLAADWETLKAEEDEWEKKYPNPKFLAAWRRHREVYGYTMRAELVYALKKALDEDPDLQLEPAFTHILVDEYQDLNRCEIAVLQRLAGDERSLFTAGDDDQSIYGFRKAFPQGLREFGTTYPGAAEEELAECHRCDRKTGRIYSDPIVGALAEKGLDAELPSDPLAVLDQDDGRQLICVLRLLQEPEYDLAWRELLELRNNHIGKGTLLTVFEFAAEKLIRYYEALDDVPHHVPNAMK